MDVFKKIQEMQEKVQELNEPLNCVIMHMSTAEKLLEYFLGIECVIAPICPKEKIIMAKCKSQYIANCESPKDDK